jgi:hypothetical protein
MALGALFAMHTAEQLATPFGWRLYLAAKLGVVLSLVAVVLLWLHVLDRSAMPSTLFVPPKETGTTPTGCGDGWITLPSSCWGELLRYRLLSVHFTLKATKANASLKAELVEMEAMLAQMGPPLDTPTQRRAVFESLVMKYLRELPVRLHGNPGADITSCVLQKLTSLAPVMAPPVGEHADDRMR